MNYRLYFPHLDVQALVPKPPEVGMGVLRKSLANGVMASEEFVLGSVEGLAFWERV